LQESQPNLQKALAAAEAALDRKALEPALLDLSDEDSYTDFLLVVSARSDRQVRSIADHVIEALTEQGYKLLGVEGRREGRWALVDFGDVVVHVFYHPLREFYDVEGLWVDAKRVPLQVPPDQRIRPYDPEELGYSLAK
jgi:ribosome-associated protein